MKTWLRLILVIVFVATVSFFLGKEVQYVRSNVTEKTLQNQIKQLKVEYCTLQDSCNNMLKDREILQAELKNLYLEIEDTRKRYDKKIKSISNYSNTQCDSALRARYSKLY